MRIGIICPSEIALRRFMPALSLCEEAEFAGLGIFSRGECFGMQNASDREYKAARDKEREKAQVFIDKYGGRIFESYEEIASSDETDALYIPLPPALHYRWAKTALENGKHVLVEKPATISAGDSKALAELAQEKALALHENYMFIFHRQLAAVEEMIQGGCIGDVRLYRISFGFPERSTADFRYNKALGGGALIDAGGYTIRCAFHLLGSSAKLEYARSNYLPDKYEVDISGSAALSNDKGVTAQIAFGMDNDYRCELEVWGSKGSLRTGRILTAPAGFVPEAVIRKDNTEETVKLPADDAFLRSIRYFLDCVKDKDTRKRSCISIVRQAELVDEFKTLARWEE